MSEKFYLTTTLPYVNAKPHVGFALEIVQADIICRYQRLKGKDVVFNTGTDEHGVKIYNNAKAENLDTQAYVDQNAKEFDNLKSALNLTYNNFIRTSDPKHKMSAQEFWELCQSNGDIYKKEYEVKYCIGCELEKTDSELEGGHCILHPNMEIENIAEENYFFKFSKYGPKLLEIYESRPDFVVPDFRFNEIKQFVKDGLKDFSISRLKSKMPWGVGVPGDDDQVMYVWFDALINYISTLGWPNDKENFVNFWGTQENPNAIQVAGKDNLRQQSAMWQAMLLSAGLPMSKQIMIHGFINSGGQKMSKSLGNVIDPFEVLNSLEERGLSKAQATDALRYYLAREIPTFEDGDFTMNRFEEAYTANLVNGIGNLTSRILKMASNANIRVEPQPNLDRNFKEYLDSFEIDKATDCIWQKIADLDKRIQEDEPFKVIKLDKEKGKKMIEALVIDLAGIVHMLAPILPHSAETVVSGISNLPNQPNFQLFPRI